MVTAMTFLKVNRDAVDRVAEIVSELPGVSEAYSVSGQHDIVAILRVHTNDELAELVTGHMLQVPHILDSETILTFRAYSKHDLDGIFSLGCETCEAENAKA